MIRVVVLALICMSGCSAWLFGKTCKDAVGKYCKEKDDQAVVCDACDCGETHISDATLCNKSADPLLCHAKNQDTCVGIPGKKFCDSKYGLEYGCGKVGDCWSQCIGEDMGNGDWCYLAKREVGNRDKIACSNHTTCEPSAIGAMCTGKCNSALLKM